MKKRSVLHELLNRPAKEISQRDNMQVSLNKESYIILDSFCRQQGVSRKAVVEALIKDHLSDRIE